MRNPIAIDLRRRRRRRFVLIRRAREMRFSFTSVGGPSGQRWWWCLSPDAATARAGRRTRCPIQSVSSDLSACLLSHKIVTITHARARTPTHHAVFATALRAPAVATTVQLNVIQTFKFRNFFLVPSRRVDDASDEIALNLSDVETKPKTDEIRDVQSFFLQLPCARCTQ